jgi:hypothetical protein
MKLEMNRAWNDALRLLNGSREVILIVAGVFFFLPYFAFMLVAPDPMAGLGTTQPPDAETMMARLSEFYARVWWVILLIGILQGIGMLGLLALLTDRRRPTVAEALKIGAVKVLPYIVAYLLIGLALGILVMLLATLAALAGVPSLGVLIGFVAVIVWLWLFVRFALVGPVMVKEGMSNPLAALRRSWALTRTNGWRLFAFFFLLFVAMIVVTMVISTVFGLILSLFGPDGATFGDAFVVSLINAGWATLLLAVLSAVHDQFAGPSQAALGQTFE